VKSARDRAGNRSGPAGAASRLVIASPVSMVFLPRAIRARVMMRLT
jgi:hypothetical protein